MSLIFAVNTSISGDALALAELDSVYIRSTVTLTSTGGNGLIGTGAKHNALIYGMIEASHDGISIGSASSTHIVMGAAGSIYAGDDGIAVGGSGTSIVNRGSIVGLAGNGITLSAGVIGTTAPPPSGDPAYRVVNAGSIIGSIGVSMTDHFANILNNGSITGTDGIAINLVNSSTGSPGQLSTDLIRNFGTIEGNIFVNEARGEIFRNGGTINGDVLLTNTYYTSVSYDSFADSNVANNGVLRGDLTISGAHNFMLRNNGSIEGDITLDNDYGGTIDLSRGTVGGSVYLKVGYITLTLGNNPVNVVGGSGLGSEYYPSFAGATKGVIIDMASGETSLGTKLSGSFAAITGSNFDDTFYASNSASSFFGANGNDVAVGSYGADYLDGGNGNDTLSGNAGDDRLIGGQGNDTLLGGDGKDELGGDNGNDILNGGAGIDQLTGGAGKDIFVFDSAVLSQTDNDTISDFSGSKGDGDRIDLSAIDAVSSTVANEAFKWIGTDSFHKVAGELRFQPSLDGGFLRGDVNGDGVADFSITLLHGGTPVPGIDIVL